MLARNEAHQIERALRSVPVGAATLVIDADSTDATAEIARSCGARVITRPWTNFVEARKFALSKIDTPWALMLDADEVIDARLRQDIVACDGRAAAYTVLRTTFYCGRPMRLWANEPLIRLFRRDLARIATRPSAGSAPLHEHVIVDGIVGALKGTLEHYSYPTARSYWSKFDRYTGIEAQSVRPSARRACVAAVTFSPRFARLLLKGGARDGWRGVVVAYGSALYPAAVAWRALSQRKRRR